MEVAERTKERSPVILAVIALLVIGFSLLISTFQTFRHQREAEEQHLFLTTRAVLLSVESSVRRAPVREDRDRLTPRTAELFQALEQDGNVLFIGIVDAYAGQMLTSPLHGNSPVQLPEHVIASLARNGEWHGRLMLGSRGAYLYGKQLEPLRGMHMSLRDDFGPPAFLVVGLDLEKHLSAYAGFRKNILFQALYILAAAIFTWGLGMGFLARRKQARKAAALERFQAKLLDNLPDGLITLTSEGVIRSANPAALSILRCKSREILGKTAAALPGELPECAVRAGRDSNANWQHVTHDGCELEVLALPLANDEDNACLLIIRDRTMLFNLEKSLANAEKLAAVGTLAAGVAHEVRNPLSSLRGFAQYFVKKLSGQSPEEEYAKTMVREADRLNRVITDLLFLGRPKEIQPKDVNLEALMREITSLLRFDLEQSRRKLDVRLDMPTLYADQDGLKQALLNLLLNSLDALEEKDTRRNADLQIPLLPEAVPARQTTDLDHEMEPDPLNEEAKVIVHAGSDPSHPSLPDPTVSSHLRIVSGSSPHGNWIEVQDTGCGMTHAQRAQAFEPFFTAKERGTGLGLALVQRTMLDHGGAAFIASEPGKGCTVRLFFPANPHAEASSPSAAVPLRSPVQLPKQGEQHEIRAGDR